MAQRILFPEWRAENEATKYPFAQCASLTNGSKTILEGMFLDASLYPIGGGYDLHISEVVITNDAVRIYIGTVAQKQLCSATFSRLAPPDLLKVVDSANRPAGVLVSESSRLGLFNGWGTGVHQFTLKQTMFAASCVVPIPDTGVRGIRLADGTVLTGEVWLVGGKGVTLSSRTDLEARRDNPQGKPVTTITIDAVGDPLFRRCACGDLFETPSFVQTLTFVDKNQTVVVSPGDYGNIRIAVNNDLAQHPVLRISATDKGLYVHAVGTLLQSVR